MRLTSSKNLTIAAAMAMTAVMLFTSPANALTGVNNQTRIPPATSASRALAR